MYSFNRKKENNKKLHPGGVQRWFLPHIAYNICIPGGGVRKIFCFMKEKQEIKKTEVFALIPRPQ